jgi:hypothetical protein
MSLALAITSSRDVSGHRLGWPSGHDPLEHNAIGHVLMRPRCDGVLIGRVSCRVDDLKSHGTLSSGRIAVTAGARRERIFARPNARATIVMGVRRCDMLARGARSIPPGSIGADPRAVGSTESFDMALAQVVYAHGRYHSPGSGLPCRRGCSTARRSRVSNASARPSMSHAVVLESQTARATFQGLTRCRFWAQGFVHVEGG